MQSRKTTFNSLRKAHLSENSLAWKSNLQKNKMMGKGFFYSLKAPVRLLHLEGGQSPERLCKPNICVLLGSFFWSTRTTHKWSSSNSTFRLTMTGFQLYSYFICLNKQVPYNRPNSSEFTTHNHQSSIILLTRQRMT
jgi:hypothetical protein